MHNLIDMPTNKTCVISHGISMLVCPSLMLIYFYYKKLSKESKKICYKHPSDLHWLYWSVWGPSFRIILLKFWCIYLTVPLRIPRTSGHALSSKSLDYLFQVCFFINNKPFFYSLSIYL